MIAEYLEKAIKFEGLAVEEPLTSIK